MTAVGSCWPKSSATMTLTIALPSIDAIPRDHPMLITVVEAEDEDDRHRLALRRLTIAPFGAEYIVVGGKPAGVDRRRARSVARHPSLRGADCAGRCGTWRLVSRHRSLSPVAAMAERARTIGVEDLSARLPVAKPSDELGQLASTFNELLARLETSLVQQRQFMADASHELRTPVTTTRTAATVALQQPHRDET